MVKNNYAAWQIDASEFLNEWPDEKKLQFFSRYAILAPSGHNTQPWDLSIAKKQLQVKVNESRHLSIDGSGLLSVEPYISIGTFIEVLCLAAKGFGYDLSVKLFPKKDYVAKVAIERSVPTKPLLLDSIVSRVSNRNNFETSTINKSVINEITSYELSGINVTTVTEREDIDFVANETEQAITSIMGKLKYRKELSKWVRTNFSRKYDGMPGFTHGFGNIAALISKLAVRYAPKHGPQAKKSKDLIVNAGALVIVRCDSDDKESFVNAGRLYSRICVLANSHGLATSALGAAVLDADTREHIKDRFGIKDRPIYILRLGKAKVRAAHSPRLPLRKVLN